MASSLTSSSSSSSSSSSTSSLSGLKFSVFFLRLDFWDEVVGPNPLGVLRAAAVERIIRVLAWDEDEKEEGKVRRGKGTGTWRTEPIVELCDKFDAVQVLVLRGVGEGSLFCARLKMGPFYALRLVLMGHFGWPHVRLLASCLIR